MTNKIKDVFGIAYDSWAENVSVADKRWTDATNEDEKMAWANTWAASLLAHAAIEAAAAAAIEATERKEIAITIAKTLATKRVEEEVIAWEAEARAEEKVKKAEEAWAKAAWAAEAAAEEEKAASETVEEAWTTLAKAEKEVNKVMEARAKATAKRRQNRNKNE